MTIFNSGGVGRSNLEKVADTILWFPRRLWMGRSVHVIQNENEEGYKIKRDSKYRSLTELTGSGLAGCAETPSFGVGVVVIAYIAFYVLSCVAALPFLVVGLPLKKIALNHSEKAKAYSSLVNKALNLKITEEEIESKTKLIESISEIIKNNKDILEAFDREPALNSDRVIKHHIHNTKEVLKHNEKTIEKEKNKLNILKENIKKHEDKTNSAFEKYKNIGG